MFVARTREMELLERCFASGSFEMVPVWGRRRVGKTRLLNEFATSKARTHFFTARRTTMHENLSSLSSAILSWHDPANDLGKAAPAPIFPNFESAFEHVFAEAEQDRTLLVIDEYPYLAESYPGVSSLLQELIDRHQETSKLMLVLCGSSMSFMEHQVLGEKSPLYGRRTAQLKVEPFDYLDSSLLLGGADPITALELYALVGGVPLYLRQLDGRKSTEWNIAQKMIGLGRYLYAEPQNFLMQEISSPAPYSSVIESVAHGRTRPVEIANATGIQGPNVNEYLKRLGELGVIQRETPVGRAKKRQVLYRVADNLFRFWHGVAMRYQQAIELGAEDAVAHRIVNHDLSNFMGKAFESICREWLARSLARGEFGMLPSRIGSWWGTDPIAHEQVDVDVAAVGADGELVCGECKWTSDPVTADAIETLAHRAHLVMEDPRSTQLVMFSKSGFANSALREAERRGNVRLVEAKDMFTA